MPTQYSYRSRNNRFKSAPSQSRRKNTRVKGTYINPSRFVQSATMHQEEAYVPVNRFEDFAIDELIMRNLRAMNFTTPSPIQDEAIPHGLVGKDVVGIANTGTGKTAAFAIPLLNRLMSDPHAKALILAPTRELAEQIQQQCTVLSKGSNVQSVLLIGGTSMGPQFKGLQRRPRLVIGTPGRVKDHLERRTLRVQDCNIVVLDEVDRMLDMGFVHDIRHILSLTNENRQSFYFSATLDERVKSIIDGFSSDPVHISVKSGETSANVEQNVVTYAAGDNKLDMLHDILIDGATSKAIIFDDTQRSVERLSNELIARGFPTDAIHGGKSQSQRRRVLKRFKDNEITILVATDVAARGIDVSDVSHVINFTVPQSYEDYVHRIGRTGRAGNVGYALTFVEQSRTPVRR